MRFSLEKKISIKRNILYKKRFEMDDEEEPMYCNNCGRKMKKRTVKNPTGSWDTWDCPFCHP